MAVVRNSYINAKLNPKDYEKFQDNNSKALKCGGLSESCVVHKAFSQSETSQMPFGVSAKLSFISN
jgi:hypothetical protein